MSTAKERLQDMIYSLELQLRQLDYDVRDHRFDEQRYRLNCDAYWLDDDYRAKRAYVIHEIERLKKLLNNDNMDMD